MGEYQNFLVKADTERLLEVLQNIIENAIKYGSGKKIGISISKEEYFTWKEENQDVEC